MEDNTTKIELMKPVFLKAGIPIALSVAGFVLAKFALGRKNKGLHDSTTEFHVNNSINASDLLCSHDNSLDMESEHNSSNSCDNNSLDNLETDNTCELEKEINCLKGRIQDLQGNESELKFRFLHYIELKDQEMVLMELENRLLIEIVRSEFLDRELLSMEAQSKRFEGMVVDFLIMVKQLEFLRLENEVLHRRIIRLLREAKEKSRVMVQMNTTIEAGEAKILQNREELRRREHMIGVLESKILELKIIMDKQQGEKNELVNKLNLVEKSASSKDYNKFEIEQPERDRAAEVKELIYLRWCNACLRHELMRRNQEQEEKVEGKHSHQLEELCFKENGLECESPVSEHEESCLISTTYGRNNAHTHFKRPKLIDKFKRWVEGREKTKLKSDQA